MKPTCVIPGCAKPRIQSNKLCGMHRSRKTVNGNPLIRSRRVLLTQQPCTVDGCRNRVAGKGLCKRHHQQMLRRGDPLAPALIKPDWSDAEVEVVIELMDSERPWVPSAMAELPGRTYGAVTSKAYELRHNL